MQLDAHQPIFRALADPTRRAILSMLAESDRPISDIASAFQITRPAVAKHLKILREGNLITVTENGRERINHINPQSLKTAAEWINQFWDERLILLKQAVEAPND